mmetsp:Transcript_5831/g.18699  ORF Transcript_5831/g.18699 Transcript_5831/m.18699 type:complete len:288 (-) Transcript_5831:9-872(-)
MPGLDAESSSNLQGSSSSSRAWAGSEGASDLEEVVEVVRAVAQEGVEGRGLGRVAEGRAVGEVLQDARGVEPRARAVVRRGERHQRRVDDAQEEQAARQALLPAARRQAQDHVEQDGQRRREAPAPQRRQHARGQQRRIRGGILALQQHLAQHGLQPALALGPPPHQRRRELHRGRGAVAQHRLRAAGQLVRHQILEDAEQQPLLPQIRVQVVEQLVHQELGQPAPERLGARPGLRGMRCPVQRKQLRHERWRAVQQIQRHRMALRPRRIARVRARAACCCCCCCCC